MKPYSDNTISDNTFERKFKNDVQSDELVWHRDHYDRYITVIDGENWKIQLDNNLPETLEKNIIYYIPKNVFHRLIKGENDLILEIIEDKNTIDNH